jgi:hypothetical protein
MSSASHLAAVVASPEVANFLARMREPALKTLLTVRASIIAALLFTGSHILAAAMHS